MLQRDKKPVRGGIDSAYRAFKVWLGTHPYGTEGVMVQLMIACPETGQPVFTGLYADDATLPHARAAVGCPHCGDLHDWNPAEAWAEQPRD